MIYAGLAESNGSLLLGCWVYHYRYLHAVSKKTDNSTVRLSPLDFKGKDFRIGPPKISHFATLEWQKTMLEAKRRVNFDTEMQ